MSNHRDALPKRIDLELSEGNNYVILLNAIGTVAETTPLAEILQYECLQITNGYSPKPYPYTAGSSTYDSASGYQKAALTIAFTEAANGLGYDFTHVARIQGRGVTANKLISSIDTSSDQITVFDHELSGGDAVFVTATGVLPGGLTIQKYYAKVLSQDTIELHSTVALNSKVNITSAGSGTLYLRYANGFLKSFSPLAGRVNPGDIKSVIYQIQTK